jgi:O-acetylserine/cysteine efflux transporter
MPFLHIVLAVVIPLLWGPVYTLAKPAVENWFPPVILVTFIYLIVAAVLSPLVPRARTGWKTLFLLALFGCTIQSTMVYYALLLLPASTAVLLMQLQLPVGVIASWCMGRDKPNLKNGLGALICLIGIGIVVGMPEATEAYLGIGAMLICVTSWAIVQAAIPVVAKDQGTTLYAAMARHAAPQMIVVALLVEGGNLAGLATIPFQGWAAVAGIALLGFALPYSIWYWLLMRHRTDELLPFLLLMPVFGVAVAAWQLGESLPPTLLAGGAIILIGIATVIWRGNRRAGVDAPPAE